MMESTLKLPEVSEGIKALVENIMAGIPIDRPTSNSAGVIPLRWYLNCLDERNSIIQIIRDNKRFNNVAISQPHPRCGIFYFTIQSPNLNLKFRTNLITGSAMAGTGQTQADGRVNDDGNLRPANATEVRREIEHILLESKRRMSGFADFVATSWQSGPDHPDYPLWRPVSCRFEVDPFQPGLLDIDNKATSDLNDDETIVLLNRQAMGLERLYNLMEGFMKCLLDAGRTSDKGASFSTDGTDVFTANAGFVADFIFLHLRYMNENIKQVRLFLIENEGSVNKYILNRDISCVLDDFASMGI